MARAKSSLVLPYDVYVCVRHNSSRKDAALRSFYLCDECTSSFVEGAFHSAAPVYEGERLFGYCSLCNRRSDAIRLRQWCLCTTCERVARSMGRGMVAAQYVLDWWESNILPISPALELQQTDPPILRARGDRKTEGPKECRADFTATERSTALDALTLELKTGRSPIGAGMSQFQLDTTDCDDILTVVREKLVPGYIIHAQVVEQFDPPTSFYRAVGLWWTDVFRMGEAFQSVRRRQTEQRYAAFFKRSAFSAMETFVEEIRSERYRELSSRLRADGLPEMYRLT